MPQPLSFFTSIVYKIIFYIVFLLGIMMFLPSAFCFTQNIQLSEIDPFSEFIEIENISDENINITDWKWSEMSGTTEKFYDIQEIEIAAHQFLIIEMSRKLNNGGETVRIYNNSGEKIDEIIIPKAQTDKTYQKINGEWVWENATKNEANQINESNENSENETDETDENASNNTKYNIIISEVLPNPEGVDGNDNEFFELFNNEESVADISSWYIVDKSGKKFIFPENTILQSKEYKSFYKRDSKIILNNSNETLTLFSSADEKISEISFLESAKSGESYSYFSGEYKWTSNISPNRQNILPTKEETNETDETKKTEEKEDFSLFPPFSNANNYTFHKNIEMKIITVSPRSSPDFIEIECTKCSGNIAGIRLGIDGIAYTFPQNSSAETGDILRLEFQKNNNENDIKEKISSSGQKTYIFTVKSKGLVFSDETVTIGTAFGRIIDAMCYANMNGNLISQEKKEIGQLILHNQWKGELKEWSCSDSSAFPKNSIFKRIGKIDTNSKKDFKRMRNINNEKFDETDEVKKKKNNIWFSQLVFYKNFIQLGIVNNGDEKINIKDWYIANKEKWMIDISDENIFLYPHQEIFVQFSSSQAKKYIKENMTLEIRNNNGEIFDVLCVNLAKDKKNKKKSIDIISRWKSENLWKKEKKIDRCFEYHSIQNIEKYKRNLFTRPSSVGQYAKEILKENRIKFPIAKKTENKARSENPENNEHFKNDNNKEKIEKMLLFLQKKNEKKKSDEGNIRERNKQNEQNEQNEKDKKDELYIFRIETEITAKGLRFYGTVPKKKAGEKKIKKVKIIIPSRNLEITIPVKKYKFSGTLEQTIKKGRYAIDIHFIRAKKEEEFFQRQRILIAKKVLPNEIENIQFAKILPNPKGRDRKNEQIILANMQDSAGWMRNWSLVVETDKKKKTKTLPSFFLEAKEKISIPALYIPSLRNKNATLIIYNGAKKRISEISWTQARENEYFGIYAPKYFSPIKKKKKNTKKTKKKKYKKKYKKKGGNNTLYLSNKNKKTIFRYPKKEKRKGLIISHQENSIFIFSKYYEKNKENISQPIEKNMIIEYKIPQYLEYSELFFSRGSEVFLWYKKGELKEVTPIISSSDFAFGGNNQENNNNTNSFFHRYLVQIFIFLGIFGAGGMTSFTLRNFRNRQGKL